MNSNETSETNANANDSRQNASGTMSPQEHAILNVLVRESEPLPFPTATLRMSVGPDVEEYVIPEEKRQEVLDKVYPFMPCPKIGDTLFDLHEGRSFSVRDYKVIRENGRNLLVSPYYARSGGMVVDWMPGEMPAEGSTVMMVRDDPASRSVGTIACPMK